MTGARECRKRPLVGARSVLAGPPAQPGLDERIDLSVEHSLGVAYLLAGSHILDQRVWLQHVVADLRAELGRQDLAANLVEMLGGLLLLALKQAGLQDFH